MIEELLQEIVDFCNNEINPALTAKNLETISFKLGTPSSKHEIRKAGIMLDPDSDGIEYDGWNATVHIALDIRLLSEDDGTPTNLYKYVDVIRALFANELFEQGTELVSINGYNAFETLEPQIIVRLEVIVVTSEGESYE